MNNKQLIDLGIEDSALRKQILELHGEGIETAKEKATATAERNAEKAEKEASKRESALQKKVDELQKVVDNIPADSEDWQKKHDELKAATDKAIADKDSEIKSLKDGYESEKTTAKTAAALESALLAAGANAKYVKKIIKDIDISTLILDGDTIKDIDKHIETAKNAGWADMFGTVETKGVDVGKPPQNTGGKSFSFDEIQKMSPDEINANWEGISASLEKK